MRARRIIFGGLVCFLFCLVSCQNYEVQESSPIQFGITVDMGNKPQTKTAYSGVVAKDVERIDWSNDDRILIFMFTDTDWGNTVISQQRQEYRVVNIEPQGIKSFAQVAAVGQPLSWENGNYRFVGIYPYGGGTIANWEKRWNKSPIKFSLPSTQDGDMRNCFMVASTSEYSPKRDADTGEYGPNEPVMLEFHPVVTTLYFVLTNDTEDAIDVSQINLNSNFWFPLVGTYYVGVDSYSYTGHEGGVSDVILNVNRKIAKDESVGIPLFLIPYNREAKDISISIELADRKLSNTLANKTVSTFLAGNKYDILVNLSGNSSDIELPELPPVNPDGLGLGAVQFIYATIKPGLLEVFRALLGDDFINNKIDKLPTPVSVDAFYAMLTRDEIVTILEYLQTASKVSIEYTSFMNSTVTAEEFKRLIPCVRELSLRIENDVDLYFDGMDFLKTIDVQGNGKVIIHADNCDKLTTIKWWDKQKQNGSGIWIDGVWYPAS